MNRIFAALALTVLTLAPAAASAAAPSGGRSEAERKLAFVRSVTGDRSWRCSMVPMTNPGQRDLPPLLAHLQGHLESGRATEASKRLDLEAPSGGGGVAHHRHGGTLLLGSGRGHAGRSIGATWRRIRSTRLTPGTAATPDTERGGRTGTRHVIGRASRTYLPALPPFPPPRMNVSESAEPS